MDSKHAKYIVGQYWRLFHIAQIGLFFNSRVQPMESKAGGVLANDKSVSVGRRKELPIFVY